MSKKETESKTQKTADGFVNFNARLGVGTRGGPGPQNLLSKGHYDYNLVTRDRIQLEMAYRGSWIVGQVIDCVAEDMTRSGIDIITNEASEDIPEIKTAMARLSIWDSLRENITWGRLYGGALGLIQLEGQDLAEPIDLDSIDIGDFKGLVVYDRWQLNPVVDKIIDSGPSMGLPEFYDIVLGSNLNDPGQLPGGTDTGRPNGQIRVHHSRCIRIDGIKLPFFQAITEQMWSESVLERMWDRLIMFDDATASTGNLISRAQLRTVGIDGLREIFAAGGKAQENLLAQFEYMRELQNNEGITLLDKLDTFMVNAYTFAGLSDVLIQFGQQVSGACSPPIPLVRLFGQSPAGMSATGESDIRLYYDGILAKQEKDLRNPLDIVLRVMWRSVIGKPAPKDLGFDFVPLWQMSALDKANVTKLNVDAVLEVEGAGVIDKATALKELKQSSGDTGLFTHITDEMITEAENEEPPMPEEEVSSTESGSVGEPNEPPTTPKPKVGDSAWKKIKQWVFDSLKTKDATQADLVTSEMPLVTNTKAKDEPISDIEKIRKFAYGK